MTDRYNGLYIVLEEPTRSDDAQSIIDAIKMIKGVASVEPNVANFSDHIAKETAKREVYTKIRKIFEER